MSTQNAEGMRFSINDTVCFACHCSFMADEWDHRHSDASGEDVHEDCCDVCHGDDATHAIQFDLRRVDLVLLIMGEYLEERHGEDGWRQAARIIERLVDAGLLDNDGDVP